jgi:ribosome-associated toxin RatA of RatAB toxin-antitoxin module
MKEVNYTLDHREDPSRNRVEWSLVDSDTFKKNSGFWELKEIAPGKTDVSYSLEVDFKIPIPGFILNRLVKGSLPSMIQSFEKRAQS